MKKLKHIFSELNRLHILGIAILLVIIAGLVGAVVKPAERGCTLKGCHCVEPVQTDSTDDPDDLQLQPVTGEMECNSCYGTDYLFYLGVLEVVKECDQIQQVYVCEAGEKTGEYYRDEGCSYELNTVIS